MSGSSSVEIDVSTPQHDGVAQPITFAMPRPTRNTTIPTSTPPTSPASESQLIVEPAMGAKLLTARSFRSIPDAVCEALAGEIGTSSTAAGESDFGATLFG